MQYGIVIYFRTMYNHLKTLLLQCATSNLRDILKEQNRPPRV